MNYKNLIVDFIIIVVVSVIMSSDAIVSKLVWLRDESGVPKPIIFGILLLMLIIGFAGLYKNEMEKRELEDKNKVKDDKTDEV